jgi:hypothetical protein
MSDPQDFVIRRGTNRATTGRPHNAAAVALRKIEEAEAPAKPRYFAVESIRALQDYRRVKELTQKQLDQACSFPSGTMNLLEGRRVEPTRVQLQKLNNLVGHGLTLD